MRFLVSGNADNGGPKDVVGMLESVLKASLKMREKWDDEEKIFGGNPAGQSAGCLFFGTSPAKELGRIFFLPDRLFAAMDNLEIKSLDSNETQ